MKVEVEKPGVNVIDAAARGAGDGLQLALNIGGMLIAFLALIALVNGVLGWVHTLPCHGLVSGVDAEAVRHRLRARGLAAGRELEGRLADRQPARHAPGAERVRRLPAAWAKSSSRSIRARFVIATYALCGFANFSSIAIQIGGIGALAPNRKIAIWRGSGLKAMMAGTMANFMSRLHRGNAAVIREAAAFLKSKRAALARARPSCSAAPKPPFVDALEDRHEIDYSEIPGWPVPTVQGHAGKLIIGHVGRTRDRRAQRPRPPLRRLHAAAGHLRRSRARPAWA